MILETVKASPRDRRFFSRMLSKKSLTAKESRQDLAPEELECTLTSYDQDCPSSPPNMPDGPVQSLSSLVDLNLQRWRSVDQKIDASLKKAEALANHYGEDLATMIQESASYSSYPSSGATSYASDIISVAESRPDDWGKVSRKIDDSLSKVELLARRLGFAQENLRFYAE